MPYISPEFVKRIQEESESEIVSIIGKYVKLQKSGSNWVGLSPFSNEKTPSFNVIPSKKIFKCFSSDHAGGAITFLMLSQGFTFPEAIEEIAKILNWPVEYDDTPVSREYVARLEKKESLTPLMRFAADRYQQAFKDLPADHPAKLEIYHYRGYTDKIVEQWGIGYAPGGRFLYSVFLEHGRVVPATDAGLISEERSKDRFFDRIMFPILDEKGKPIGFAGRALVKDKKVAKWVNSPETILYNKSEVLYGYHTAREHIFRTGTAILVEGYNDVIAFHRWGLKNTVASSGTSITEEQIKLLRKSASKIILCMDGDERGIASMVKYIPAFIAAGFRVEILSLLDGLDPDDFCRTYRESLEKFPNLLPNLLAEDITSDGFGFLMNYHLKGSAVEKAKGTQELTRIIATIHDDPTVKIYTAWLAKQSDLTKTDITKWVNDAKKEKEVADAPQPPVSTEKKERYSLPKLVNTPIEELLPTIEQYQLFQSNNRIYILTGEEPPFHFRSVSNFTIEIIQHMEDEKYPSKLLRVKNVRNEEKIFDIPSSEMNTPQSFDKILTDQGNYFFEGGRYELNKLRAYLYDHMGMGRRIEMLCQQPEGFWCWNNSVLLESGEEIPISENGLVKIDSTSYYVPSANKIYKKNVFKYQPQKKAILLQAKQSFQNYTDLVRKVHGDHAITGLLFTFASAFQDIVIPESKGFPIFFLYGPPSTGKDQLMEICQSFFGKPQEAINLEGNASTIKAQIREFAQFTNAISHLSEYSNGDPNLDGVLKGLWDRRGYKRGDASSKIATDSIPILSSVGLTGNSYPTNPALISRLVAEEMVQREFSEEQLANYDKLADLTMQGISSYTNDMLKHRSRVKAEFKKKFRAFKQGFAECIPGVTARLTTNISILASFYEIFKDDFIFPFTHTEMKEHFIKITKTQMRKLASANIVTKWWDCYLASMRGLKDDQLYVGRDFEIKGNYIYFNFTTAYNKIQRQWWMQYHEAAPGKSTLMDALKKDTAFVEYHEKGARIGGKNTSAMVLDIKHIVAGEDLINAAEWQAISHTSSPATPSEKDRDPEEELPF